MSRVLRRRGVLLSSCAVVLLGSVYVAAPADSAPAASAPQSHHDGPPVVTAPEADWITQDVWVTTTVDSDHDGHRDRVHAFVTRPAPKDVGDRKLSVVYEASPYYAGGNDITNHDVDVPLYEPNGHGHGNGVDHDRRAGARTADVGPKLQIGGLERRWVPEGYAVVRAESIGSGESEGCPTTGDPSETAGAKSVVDWLNGRATATDAAGNRVSPDWSTGDVGMIGTSYNGTLPNAVASTGVKGLKTIIPVSAISRWYDYYRAHGAVIAAGGYQGEDTDVLAEYVYTRSDQDICKPVIDRLTRDQDRLTGDYSPFWAARDYVPDAKRVRASVLVAHGLSDWNVKTSQAAQWYQALARNGVERKIYWHQGGHGGEPPLDLQKQWFAHYLYGVRNGVQDGDRALIQREDGTQKWYSDWPAPQARQTSYSMSPTGADGVGDLSAGRAHGRPASQTFTDVPTLNPAELAANPDAAHGLVFTTTPLASASRLSGTPRADLRLQFGQPAANLSVAVVDLDPAGKVTRVVTEGWQDPQNRSSLSRTQAIRPGQSYRIGVELQPNDYVFAAGHRIGLVVMQTDKDFTLRPPAGNTVTVDLRHSSATLPLLDAS